MVESYRPKNLQEALELRREHGAIPLAGGTDLMVRYRYESGAVPAYPGPVMLISRMEEIGKIESRRGELHIGAAATMNRVLAHPEVPEVLKEAVRTVAARGLRNAATLAGNICNASPAADSVVALYALDAQLVLQSSDGARTVPIEEFITGPGRTTLGAAELLTDIIVPENRETVHLFKKVGTRKANALSKLAIAATGRVAGGVVEEARIAVNAVAPVIIRSREIERQITGLSVAQAREKVDELLAGYDELITPIDDQRSTARYRKRVAMNLLRHFLSDYLLKGDE
jgi:CO/xanthine dehydrogenase FAD-binding subunit